MNGLRLSDRALAVYKKTAAQLEAGQIKEAQETIRTQSGSDPHLKNLHGVCLMRSGFAAEAVRLYRGLVLSSGAMVLRPNAPTVFKTNFATALLVDNHVAGCESLLDEIADESNPAVQRLRAAVQKWKSELSLWQRLLLRFGVEPDHPVRLDFAPGDLESE